jgi:hypothetical protein
MELAVQDIINTFNRFKMLNGYEKVIDVDGKPKAVFTPYQFNESTAWNIAKNINVLRKLVTEYEEDNKLMVETMKVDEKTINTDPEKYKTFTEELTKVLEKKVEVSGLLKIKLSGLNLSHNPIQPGLLADIADHIDGEN